MKKTFLVSGALIAALSFGGVAHACDMHGFGFNFTMRDAGWQNYNPEASTVDPAFADNEMLTPLDEELLARQKAKPNFSNAANLAAMKAKARVKKKDQDKSSDKSEKQTSVKKAALDADR